jgi:hypothetical protein
MEKNISQILIEKGISTWAKACEYLEGKKIKVIGRTSGHQYPDRFVFTIKTQNNNLKTHQLLNSFPPTTGIANIGKGLNYSGSIYFQDMTIDCSSLEDLKSELGVLTKTFNKEEAELKMKIEILERFDLDEFDDNMLKAHKIFTSLGLSTNDEFKKVYKSIL